MQIRMEHFVATFIEVAILKIYISKDFGLKISSLYNVQNEILKSY